MGSRAGSRGGSPACRVALSCMIARTCHTAAQQAAAAIRLSHVGQAEHGCRASELRQDGAAAAAATLLPARLPLLAQRHMRPGALQLHMGRHVGRQGGSKREGAGSAPNASSSPDMSCCSCCCGAAARRRGGGVGAGRPRNGGREPCRPAARPRCRGALLPRAW